MVRKAVGKWKKKTEVALPLNPNPGNFHIQSNAVMSPSKRSFAMSPTRNRSRLSSESYSPTKGRRSRLSSESSPRKYKSVSGVPGSNGTNGNGAESPDHMISGRTTKMSSMSTMGGTMKRNKSSQNSLVPCSGPGAMDDYIKYVKEGELYFDHSLAVSNDHQKISQKIGIFF